MSGTYAPVGGCILVLILFSPCILCCCVKKIADMLKQKPNHHNDQSLTGGQMVGQIALGPIENIPVPSPTFNNPVPSPTFTNPDPPPTFTNTAPPPQAPPGYNLVPQSDIPVPPGFKLVPLSQLHGSQAPPPGYTLVKL